MTDSDPLAFARDRLNAVLALNGRIDDPIAADAALRGAEVAAAVAQAEALTRIADIAEAIPGLAVSVAGMVAQFGKSGLPALLGTLGEAIGHLGTSATAARDLANTVGQSTFDGQINILTSKA